MMNFLFALLDAVSGTVAVCESLAKAEELALEWKAEMLDLARDSYRELKWRHEQDFADEPFMSFMQYLETNAVNDGDLQIFVIKTGNHGYKMAKSLLDGSYDATGKLNGFLTDRVESIWMTDPSYTLCVGTGEFKANGEDLEDLAMEAAMKDHYDETQSFTDRNSAIGTMNYNHSVCHEFKPGYFSCVCIWVRVDYSDGSVDYIFPRNFEVE